VTDAAAQLEAWAAADPERWFHLEVRGGPRWPSLPRPHVWCCVGEGGRILASDLGTDVAATVAGVLREAVVVGGRDDSGEE
jgi:hypothetical protein